MGLAKVSLFVSSTLLNGFASLGGTTLSFAAFVVASAALDGPLAVIGFSEKHGGRLVTVVGAVAEGARCCHGERVVVVEGVTLVLCLL